VAVAVHPDDARYRGLVGQFVLVPIANRRVPVIADRRIDPQFGTGALKVTPGHAPLDYEIGRDHQLPTIVTLDPQGRMTPDTGKYAGMDRFAAREAVAADLKLLGLVERVEPYRTSVGHCDRCHTVIEPYISEQWFADMTGMAKRATEAIRAGRVRFHPQRWAEVALDWLDQIRPWVISRQLWWGHRIPVWQCGSCGTPQASKTPPARCTKCGKGNLTQDPDVLDTWFSSALWPFATLGWPQDTADVRYFYPTSVLVTDRGIIFLWVCRMIMVGLEFMDAVPFADVYIHPTVLTLQGRRMSKSLGTGIDPLEMADTRGYGVDAVRFALVMRASQTQQDMRFGEKMIEDVRNFNTKIWNAARFVLMNLDGFDPHASGAPAQLSAADRWIRSRYARLAGEVTASLESYELDKAAKALYDFIWSEYCDWYLELAKVDLQTLTTDRARDSAGRRSAVQRTLSSVLSGAMQLLHPIMPFLTEEVWLTLPHDGPSIMISPWPQVQSGWIDPAAEQELEVVMAVVRAVRSLRAELSIPPAQRIPVHVYAEGHQISVLRQASRYVEALAKVGSVEHHAPRDPRPSHSVASVLPGAEIHLPLKDLGGIVDFEKERRRHAKALETLHAELEQLQRRLADEAFQKNAPPEVVALQRQRHEDLRARTRRLQELLDSLASIR
jgi:valyl-tRNA synthetase